MNGSEGSEELVTPDTETDKRDMGSERLNKEFADVISVQLDNIADNAERSKKSPEEEMASRLLEIANYVCKKALDNSNMSEEEKNTFLGDVVSGLFDKKGHTYVTGDGLRKAEK